MKLSSKQKKAASQYMVIGMLALLIISAVLGIALKIKSDAYSSLFDEANANTQSVYVAVKDIEAGDTLYDMSTAPTDEDVNVEVQNVYTGLDAGLYMSADQLGQTARIDISTGVPVLSVMATDTSDITADIREVEIAVAQLMTDQRDGDYVDVRIAFPDGTDEIVLPKKKVSGLILETCTWRTSLNESEIITLTSAIIDAAVLSGGHLYTVRYTEPTIQDAAIPTYTVNPVAIDLINSDPNVVEKATQTLNLQARLALEERLAQVDEAYAEMVGNGYAQTQEMLSETVEENAEADSQAEMAEDGIVNEVVDDTIGTNEPTVESNKKKR